MRWKPERPERGAERWVLRFAWTPVLCEEGVWVWLEWVQYAQVYEMTANRHGWYFTSKQPRVATRLKEVENAVFALQLKRDAEARARKAEAMCEWLAGELYDEDYLGIYTRAARTSENEPYTPSDRLADIATIVATARAAIEQEEAE